MFFLYSAISIFCFYTAAILFFDICEDVDRGAKLVLDLRSVTMLLLWFGGGISAVSAIFG
jgi:hypothetical protein